MTCHECGAQGVSVGAACPYCGTVVVEAEALDSLLSLPADPVPVADDEEPTSFSPLAVEPGTVGPTTGFDPGVRPDPSPWQDDGDLAHFAPPPVAPSTGPALFHDPTSIDDPGIISPGSLPGAAPIEWDDDGPANPRPVHQAAKPVVSSGPPLPQRRGLDDTAPEWGAREHPPAIMAPSPPHPLDAPVVSRVKRSTGTGLPAGVLVGGPGVAATDMPLTAPVPTASPIAPAAPIPSAGPPAPPTGGAEDPDVPERPSHPRVRRWFGRGTGPDPDAGPEPEVQELPVVEDGPFPGAPEGLLDGVVPESVRTDEVHDPAGVEAAMSRLSAGARRSVLAPMSVAAALLEEGEVAEAVVQGEYQSRPGVVVLTDRRVLVANERRWAPDVRSFPFDPHLVVHGWQDDRRATLVFVRDGIGVLVGAISDRPLARDLAQRVRARCGDGPTGASPP